MFIQTRECFPIPVGRVFQIYGVLHTRQTNWTDYLNRTPVYLPSIREWDYKTRDIKLPLEGVLKKVPVTGALGL